MRRVAPAWRLVALLCFGAMMLTGARTAPAQGAPAAGAVTQVTKLSWDSRYHYNRFVIEFDKAVKYNAIDSIREKGFFYVDIYGIQVNYRRQLLEVNDFAVRYVDALSYPEHGVLRLVFYLKEQKAGYKITETTNPPRLVIDTVRGDAPGGNQSNTGTAPGTTPAGPGVSPSAPINSANAATAQLAPKGREFVPNPPQPGGQTAMVLPTIPEPRGNTPRGIGRTPGRKKVIIIDPGHGGANTGAQSNITINGKTIYEKDVTLQVAYELKRIIDQSPNMVAIMTRTDDTIVSLEDRVKFAEQMKGDMFISLHLNDGAGNNNARGPEIYFLSEKGTDSTAAKSVQDRENTDVSSSGARSRKDSSILKNILTDLQRGKLEDWQYESYLVAKNIQKNLYELPLNSQNDRGVKSANFVVLRHFYMPAVLYEIGFITNNQDLQAVINAAFQKRTAELVFNGLNDYFAASDPAFRPAHVRGNNRGRDGR